MGLSGQHFRTGRSVTPKSASTVGGVVPHAIAFSSRPAIRGNSRLSCSTLAHPKKGLSSPVPANTRANVPSNSAASFLIRSVSTARVRPPRHAAPGAGLFHEAPALFKQSLLGSQPPHCVADACRLQALGRCQGRQDRRQSLGQQGLARAWRAYHPHVMDDTAWHYQYVSGWFDTSSVDGTSVPDSTTRTRVGVSDRRTEEQAYPRHRFVSGWLGLKKSRLTTPRRGTE
jgi:hypothetical protein